MNAPAKVQPTRNRYAPIVRHHMPGIGKDETELRCSLLLMRDQATSSMRRCSDEAYGILQQVQRLADQYAYARMSFDDLSALRSQLVRLISCASGLEAFAFSLATGGTDAGGE